MELLLGYLKNTHFREGGQMGKSTYATGERVVVASVHVCTMEEGGQIFYYFGRTY